MSRSVRALANREQGQFPISTGTSLAIESLANMVPDRPKVKPEPITQIDAVLINIRTLHRNMLGSMKAADKQDVIAEDVADFLLQEMKQCADAVSKISSGKVDTFFYLCRYPDLKSEFPKARLILPNTQKQMLAKQMEDKVIGAIVENPGKFGDPKIFDYYVNGGGLSGSRVALLTHLPLDLVDRYQFKELYLLESNTGAFKAYREFGSKFKVKPEDAYFPFTKFTLQVLGDGGKMFSPLETDVVKCLADVARANKWTYMTTVEKVKYNLDNSSNKTIASFLKSLIRA